MKSAYTAGQLAILRTRPQRAEYYVAVHQPRTILLTTLSGIGAYPGASISGFSSASGNFSDVLAGMTLRIGTEPGKDDLGRIRVRKTAGIAEQTGSLIQTAEYGSGLIDWRSGACLTVVEEYRPWPIHHSYDTATSAWLVDRDTYTSQTVQYGPLVIMGPPMVGFMNGNTMPASYVGNLSYSFTPGASISTQTWRFPHGVSISSALGSSQTPVLMTYSNTSPTGRYHTLTITDTSGASHIGQRLTFCFNASNAQPYRVHFDAINGGLQRGGYSTRIYVYENGVGASQNFPEGAQVVIFENASYGTVGSSVGGNYWSRDNVVMVGWISNESLRIEPFTGELSFELETIDGVLRRTSAYDLFLESGSAASAWDMASGLTLDKAALTLAKYRSTLANVADFNPASGLAATAEVPFRSMAFGSIWDQLAYNYEALFGLVAADMQSSVWASLDAQVTGLSANLPNVMAIAQADRRDQVQIEREQYDSNTEYQLYAVMAGTTSPLAAVSPGDRINSFGTKSEITRNLTVDTQDKLITWAGNVRARENNRYKRVSIPLSGNIRLDSVPQCLVQTSLSPSQNLRGINWDNQKLIPYETNIVYDPIARHVNTEVVCETVVNGIGGSSITFPRTVTTPSTSPAPDPIPIPEPTPSTGGLVYVATTLYVARTRNFNDASPTWTNVTGAIDVATNGNIVNLVLDPRDPKNKAIVMTQYAIYGTSNLNATSPTWTVEASKTAIETQVGTITGKGCRGIQFVIGNNVQSQTWAIVQNASDFWFLGYRNEFTTNSWTWITSYFLDTETTPHAQLPIGHTVLSTDDTLWAVMHVSNNTRLDGTVVVHIVCKTYHAPNNTSTHYTYQYNRDTYRHNVTTKNIFDNFVGANSDPVNIWAEYNFGATYDTNVWFVHSRACGRVNGGNVRLRDSTNSYTQLVPSDFNLDVNEPPSSEDPQSWLSLVNPYVSDPSIVYLGDGANLFKSTNTGASWSTINSGLSASRAIGLWPYDSTRIFLLQYNDISYSIDGGVTFISKLGNWSTVFAASTVIMIVPVWIE